MSLYCKETMFFFAVSETVNLGLICCSESKFVNTNMPLEVSFHIVHLHQHEYKLRGSCFPL